MSRRDGRSYKWLLTNRTCYETWYKGYEVQRYLLSGFVETYLKLHAAQQDEFEQELNKLGQGKKEETMKFATSWMEQGIERGLEQGLIRGKLELVQKQLTRRFRPLSAEEVARLKELDADQLETLGEDFLDFQERADLTAWFEAHVPASTTN